MMSSQPSNPSSKSRVILLLDLDCFYAQCECIRLGFDAATTPLALLQWNSVLAVTYPARKFGIKRGDSWEAVAEKSKGECLAIHVPISKLEAPSTGLETEPTEYDYQSIYQLNDDQRQEARKELGIRGISSEGKACIERYRIGSAKIFETALEWITEMHLDQSIILERASIDEFFLDVTKAAAESEKISDSFLQLDKASSKTIVVGENSFHMDETDPENKLLQRGYGIAYSIRERIRDRLGFVLSAGISGNKTLAKLSAVYGKPNGQAVTYPLAIDFLLNDTEISKCRNLGGKLGSKVQELLPQGVPTKVASIARYISLPELQQRLDSDTANWVHKIARGIDTEPVTPKSESGLTKSITAFKSLPFVASGNSLNDIAPWVRLLATEIVNRVERDALQHHRYPRICTVQYTRTKGIQHKSVRIPFPSARLTTEEKVDELCEKAPQAIQSKEGDPYKVHRVGLCACEFTTREQSNAIDSFFPRETITSTKETSPRELKGDRISILEESNKRPAVDMDLELAKKLQNTYDREHRAFLTMDKKRKATKKTKTIENFFQKRSPKI